MMMMRLEKVKFTMILLFEKHSKYTRINCNGSSVHVFLNKIFKKLKSNLLYFLEYGYSENVIQEGKNNILSSLLHWSILV